MKKIYTKALSLLIVLCLLLPCSGISTLAAEHNNLSLPNASETFVDITDDVSTDESPLPSFIDEDSEQAQKHLFRLKDLEEANTYVFQNSDGTRTVYVMDENVKYVDVDGNVREKDLSLINVIGGYKTAANDIGAFMPDLPTSGIELEYSDHTVKLIPKTTASTIGSKVGDAVTYEGAFGENTILKYTPLLSGIKEDIILESYVSNAEFSFELVTDGLRLQNSEGRYFLSSPQNGEIIFWLDDIIVYDAVGRPESGRMSVETLAENERYLLTVSVDDDYLSDPATIYPVTIDPTITVSDNTASGSIIDAPIFEGYPDRNCGTYLYNSVGTTSEAYGIGRTVVKLSGLINSNEYRTISENQITNVSFCVKEASGGVSQYINLHPLTSNTTWTETSVTWNNIGTYNAAFNYGNTMYNGQWISFDITNLVKAWKYGRFSSDAGFIMINENEANNKCFCSSEYSTASYRPYVVMTYSEGITRSLYYSKYDPTKYNDSGSMPTIGSTTDLIQYKMNCYGYALGYILNGSVTINSGGGYKQQPGEFASTSNKVNTASLQVYENPTVLMDNVVSNVRLDASRLGFTLTEYSTSDTTVAQYGVSSRLIAIATGDFDYHFYMQHNDGTWSHKPGSGAIQNTSLDSNIVLTNSNIKALANEGLYTDGALKFFIITKTAVVDFPHGARCCDSMPCSHTQSVLYTKELAGDYLQTSKTKNVGSTSARIDYTKDHDVYYFTPSVTKAYSVTINCSSAVDLGCRMYDNAGVLIGSSTLTGHMTVNLIEGQKYFFDVYSKNETVTDYTFNIS